MTMNQPMLDTRDPGALDRVGTRRQAICEGARVSGGLVAAMAVGSIPVALAAMARKAGAQASMTPLQVLEFAYLLENLEAEFYLAALGMSGTPAQNTAFAPVRATLTETERNTFDQIRIHEVAHVALLRGAITDSGGTPATYSGASFDFTGGQGSGQGPFLAATTNKAFLLAAAQAFEDTGVRAYKGQAGNLLGNALLTTALQIHAVEARHAARIRRMRALAGAPVNFSGTVEGNVSGITGLSAAGAAVITLIYGGEENTTHAGVNVNSFANGFGEMDAATAAFDEPLTAAVVTDIVTPFIVA